MNTFFKAIDTFIRKSRIVWIILITVTAFAAIYTVVSIAAARKKISQLNEIYASEKPMQGNDIPEVFQIRKQNAYVLSKLALAKGDSVSLVVNLPDSMVTLDLKGVSIHHAKIVKSDVSAVFNALSPDAMLNLMGKPLKVQSHYSTIVKEQRIVRKAPKDTIEAANTTIVQDTTDLRPSFYYLGLDHGIVITVTHEHNADYSYMPLVIGQKQKIFSETLDSMKRMKLPGFVPSIRIELHKSDAKTIFKALPDEAMVVIRF
jgi:hypothetical protein